MIFEHKFTMGLKDIGENKSIKNSTILEMLEDTGAYHSDLAGYGVNQIEQTKKAWIIVGWKLHVIKRPKYGQTINVKTWGRDSSRVYTYRDFEVYNENNELCIIATSKWTLVNTENNKLERITKEITDSYDLEDKSVFENRELDKIIVPEKFTNIIEYKVTRRDIDINNHMHNLYYLELANEALPNDVYQKGPYDNVIIQYKKEIRQGDVVKCKYALYKEKNIVCIYNEDENILHAIIMFE